MNIVSSVVPLVSVLLGAGIAYFVNVRSQQRARIDQVFHDAIAAVAVAEASHDFITRVAPWQGATDEEYEKFTSELGREGNLNYIKAVASARAAVARASAYQPALAPFYRSNTEAIYDNAAEIITILRRGKASTTRESSAKPVTSRA